MTRDDSDSETGTWTKGRTGGRVGSRLYRWRITLENPLIRYRVLARPGSVPVVMCLINHPSIIRLKHAKFASRLAAHRIASRDAERNEGGMKR